MIQLNLINRIFSLILIFILIPICIISIISIKISSKGPIIHWSKRIGKNSKIFFMPKFRTMKIDTPNIATHLFKDNNQYLTSVGKFMRKSSIDEIPQLYSILKGDMVLVGPRPALFNQFDLIELRKNSKIDILKPGITGWAQINGRDEISVIKKVELDLYYLNNRSIRFDWYIILFTIIKVLKKDNIAH